MDFHLYNTLTRQKELFTPIRPGKVDFYSCGPTVYNTVHIGNLRAFLCADTLYRWLTYGLQYETRWVMNITDVDDKTIRDSQKQYPDLEPMEALQKFTRYYEELFFDDLEKLNIPRESFFQAPRATESIEAMQDLVRKITENGIGYEKEGSVYFSIEKYIEKQKYGRLLNLDLDALKTGTRTLNDEIEKEDVQDFVLWKGKKEGEPSWDFDFFGKNLPGRPGWHIECSAMEKAAFGELPFDIHSGGVDLCFPHHEDEIAQSIAGYDQDPTNFWFHNEHLMVEGEKMSKSLGNFYTLHDLLKKGYSADTIRFFLVTNHYRTKLNLSEQALQAAHEGLQRIRNFCQSLQKRQGGGDSSRKSIATQKETFKAAMCDDLNTPQAIAAVFDTLAITDCSDGLISFFQFAENIFGVRFLPKEVEVPADILQLAQQRKKAKQEKDFKKADQLRDEILKNGFEIRDEGDDYEVLPKEL